MAEVRSSMEFLMAFETTIDPASVAANVAPDQTFTVSGVELGQQVAMAVMPDLEANLSISNVHISADDTVKIRFCNPTAGAINPASQTLRLLIA